MGKCGVSLDTMRSNLQIFIMNTLKNIKRLGRREHIKCKILDSLELNVTDEAQALGVNRSALSAIRNGRADLSAEMALRIDKALKVKMGTLIHMRTGWDMAEQRKKRRRGPGARLPYNAKAETAEGQF